MVKFQAVANGKVVAEGSTMDEAIKSAEAAGFNREDVYVRSVRESPKV